MDRILRKLCPDWVAGEPGEVSPEWLRARGIRALLLDLDNTLVPWHGMEPPEAVREWLAALREAEIPACLTSNTHRPKRLAAIAEALGIQFEPHCAKPQPGGLRRALRRLDAAPEEAALVGDQVLTDILAGNRCGVTTILVKPLSKREFIGTRLVNRPLERWALNALRRRGWLRPLRPDAG